MRILAIGDFHGKFPERLKKLAKEVDLVISTGDYFPFSYRELWFKHCYKSDTELWEVLGKKKYKELLRKDLKSGEKLLSQLNRIKIPFISITGNIDHTKWRDAIDYKKEKWAWPSQNFFSKIIKKYSHIRIFDYNSIKFRGLRFVGMATSTFPGKVKSKNYKKLKKKLDRLFKKFEKEKIIFVSHNVPYKTKLSKIGNGEFRGVEKGSKLVRRIIEKYQPVLHIAGHMHENQGKCKIGKTLVVNPGAACEGKAAIIEFDVKKKKVECMRFIK